MAELLWDQAVRFTKTATDVALWDVGFGGSEWVGGAVVLRLRQSGAE